jgi:hypothetical protein
MLSLFARNDASRPLIEGPDHIRSLPSEPPLFDPHPRSTDALLAQSMNQLSMKEREKVLEDIHGVADILEEEPRFVELCLVELEEELNKVPNKDAYETARSRSMDYVSNRKFRLQFLRADSFNVRHAAVRIVAYFEAKLELFGLEKLTKCITQRDLDQDDLACLESGISQLLSVRDTTGRAILCVLPSYTPARTSTQARLRSTWYIAQIALEDEETQKRGVVGLCCYVGKSRSRSNRSATWKNVRNVSVHPIRFMACHFCFDNPKMEVLVNIAASVFETRTRIRIRAHCGRCLFFSFFRGTTRCSRAVDFLEIVYSYISYLYFLLLVLHPPTTKRYLFRMSLRTIGVWYFQRSFPNYRYS